MKPDSKNMTSWAPAVSVSYTVAFWAASILSGRPHADDGISVEAARIVEYVSSNVSRYKIRSLANRLKSDNNIDPHIRAVLTHHDGY